MQVCVYVCKYIKNIKKNIKKSKCRQSARIYILIKLNYISYRVI